MSCWKTIVIGSGASGLMAACEINDHVKKWGAAPLVLEGNSKFAKKLLATGNGRCNLTNLEISPAHYHGDPLARQILERFPAEAVMRRFEELGLLLRADGEGRVYPNSSQASTVAEALLKAAGSKESGHKVVSIERRHDPEYGKQHYFVATDDGRVHKAEEVVLACGGRSYSSLSMGASGYELARSLGHTVTELSPSLAPLRTTSKACKSLKGMRARAAATLCRRGRPVYGESGEVIFGEGHLSGICIFNLSARLRETGLRDLEVRLDLFPDRTAEEVADYLRFIKSKNQYLEFRESFDGALNLRVGQIMAAEYARSRGAEPGTYLKNLDDAFLRGAAAFAKDWRFPVTGAGSWEEAQVTAGGVPLSEVYPDTLESKISPGLYLTGELLDVDGDCGGYNLHWAWVTGMIAGRAAARTKSSIGPRTEGKP